ncbi:hypothetical protein [uncultured Mediterranean phage uvMED]|jgi:hypothetical protein|nr:hypothetical protein [uncultured Mediterranean phage uvMED]BAQ93598.1 hypothetical protein [uncultured Mediterranean phage uvMED]BAR24998.1 hypothetical protein [uncultured Mediterranean phage uvMED]BAR25046.1 hypothetical protein [uncultured Mediterranean phage uvMED]BAR25092.1 hypothetical protein [uncultured Mediterranean phage uvMED]
MNWIDRLRRGEPSDQDSQLLYYVRSELLSQYFAVVRVTWFDTKGICCISETRIEKREIDVIAEFSEVVSMALRAGSNVSVICAEDPVSLGIYDT